MHQVSFDLSLDEITKIEGAATLDLKVRDGKVAECKFAISEFKRFYTQAIRGKPVMAVPQLLARICGTCSNAHLLCSIKALEQLTSIKPTLQTTLLRQLLNYGLLIRDHALHLYVFSLPDLYNRDSILAFDENNPEEHQLLDDCFAVKAAGNALGIATGGRSVHAPFAMLGAFTKIPTKEELTRIVPMLENIRPKVLQLIQIFQDCSFSLNLPIRFAAYIDDHYSFLDGSLVTSAGETIQEQEFADYVTHTVIPYSQASAYTWKNELYMVGALARMNLNRKSLHSKTQVSAGAAMSVFPSQNIFHNNLAQAIEILHAIDTSIDLINQYQAVTETNPTIIPHAGTGIGIIEAPRGTLYHKMEVSSDGKIVMGQIVVPTGQNHLPIEKAIHTYVEGHLEQDQTSLAGEIEKIIRAFDPCMSCATHFLKINWK